MKDTPPNCAHLIQKHEPAQDTMKPTLKPGTKVQHKRNHNVTAIVDNKHPHSRSVWLRDIRVNGVPVFDANDSFPSVDITNWEEIPR